MSTELNPEVYDYADEAGVEHFIEHGWLLTQTLDTAAAEELAGWVDEIASWDDEGQGWLHHREMTDVGPQLARTENIIPFHAGLAKLLTTGTMLSDASALLGEPAVLYKEKINYKLVGGAGYAPHQDAPAYRFVDTHVSSMVAVDDASVENGCLEVVSGAHVELLATDDVGCIRSDIVDNLEWFAVPVQAGQTLWFHSRTPHRSGPNTSSKPRRALYPTYNALSEGDLRESYYAQKQAEFATSQGDTDKAQVSLIGDFQGRAVPKEDTAPRKVDS